MSLGVSHEQRRQRRPPRLVGLHKNDVRLLLEPNEFIHRSSVMLCDVMRCDVTRWSS